MKCVVDINQLLDLDVTFSSYKITLLFINELPISEYFWTIKRPMVHTGALFFLTMLSQSSLDLRISK